MKLTPSTRAPAHTRLQPLHIITSTFPTRSRKRTIHSFASAAASLHKMDASLDRHFDNTLTDWVDGQPVTVPADLLRRAVADTVEQVVRARHSGDPFAYVGSSGVAYMLWHIATASGDPEAPGNVPTNNWLERGLRYTRAAAQDVQRYSKEQYGVSLLCGASGVLVIAALMANTAERLRRSRGLNREADLLTAEAQGYVRQFNGLLSVAIGPFCKADEFLYGRAGYLYGALLLNRALGSGTVPHQNIQYITDALLRSGRRLAAAVGAPCPLWYTWPHGRGARPYLGAAHGLMGILHTLLLVHGQLQRSTRQELRACLDYVCTLERHADGAPGPGGWFPTAMADPPGQEKLLVHWCHGAPGAVFLFTRAWQVYREDSYLEVAKRAADVTWERGLLRKGPGLCHGVSGSAYAQLALHRATGEARYLHRAVQMAMFMRGEVFREAARTPDRPFSLFEGEAGAACLFADLLQPQTAAFPLYELRPRVEGGAVLATYLESVDVVDTV